MQGSLGHNEDFGFTECEKKPLEIFEPGSNRNRIMF